MRRNSGLIGPKLKVNNVATSGIYDLLDNYNARLGDKWPQTKKISSVVVSDYSPDEGDTLTWTINTEGYLDNDTLYYSVETVSGSMTTADFLDGSLTGSFQISSDVGSFEKMLTTDPTGVPDENDVFRVHIRADSISGTILATTNNITITDINVDADWRSPSTSTSTNSTYDAGPINIWFRRSVIKLNYAASFISATGGGASGTIEKIRIYITNPLSSYNTPLPNYTVSMKNHSSSISTNPGVGGWTTVWGSTSYSPTSTGWSEFDITDFVWTGGILSICFAFGQCPWGYTSDGQSYTFPGGNSNAYCWYTRTDSSGYYTHANQANSSLNSYIPRVDLYY
jgi:hypothetical protein